MTSFHPSLTVVEVLIKRPNEEKFA
jgi:hypothetical protein